MTDIDDSNETENSPTTRSSTDGRGGRDLSSRA